MLINGKTYSIGADPEVFVQDLDGTFLSAHELIEGTKKNPYPVNKGAVQVDGMALEFNIDPADDYEGFRENIMTVQQELKSMIGGREFMECQTVNFDEKFLKSVPKFNRVLGCEGDFNAWTLEENEKSSPNTLMRSVGGHVHIGGIHTNAPFDWDHYTEMARLARILDEEVGVPSLDWDYDQKRRSMYGKAGCFRPKFYGMEYRTLSNKWIFQEDTIRKVFDGVERALTKFQDKNYEPLPVVQKMIDEGLQEWEVAA